MTSKTYSDNISNSVSIKIISTIAGQSNLRPGYTKIFSFENTYSHSQGGDEDDHDSVSI